MIVAPSFKCISIYTEIKLKTGVLGLGMGDWRTAKSLPLSLIPSPSQTTVSNMIREYLYQAGICNIKGLTAQ